MCVGECAPCGATLSHMESIGVRELRRDASRWLARVRGGESFVVPDRGTPIARLGPLPPNGGYAGLIADGRLVPGSGRDLEDILDDLDADGAPEPKAGLSATLAALRHDEC